MPPSLIVLAVVLGLLVLAAVLLVPRLTRGRAEQDHDLEPVEPRPPDPPTAHDTPKNLPGAPVSDPHQPAPVSTPPAQGQTQDRPSTAVEDPVPDDRRGSTRGDLPISAVLDDQLGLAAYCRGLADFVSTCPTPMTVAVQGDWGSGKTSAMQLMAEELGKRSPAVPVVTFNTWHYTQFDLGEDMIFHLVRAIINSVDLAEPDASETARQKAENGRRKREEFLRKVWRSTSEAGKAAVAVSTRFAVEKAGGTLGTKAYEAFMAEMFAPEGSGARPLGEAAGVRSGYLEEIRREFEDLVALNNQRRGSEQTVIFIDDLDRLRPARAVEVMEVLKTILDVKGCVFVLAIDFGVVAQGVRDKYGQSMDEEKANAFFEKIIQVQFNLPVGRYPVLTMLEDHLSLNDEEKALAADLIAHSTGPNPRAQKRLLRAIALSDHVDRHRADVGEAGAPEEARAEATDLRRLAQAALQAGFPGFAHHLDSLDHPSKEDEVRKVLGWTELDLDQAESLALGDNLDEEGKARHRVWTRWRVPVSKTRDFLAFMSHFGVATGISQADDSADPPHVVRQRDRGIDPGLLEKVQGLEKDLEGSFPGLERKEVASGDGWRWYATHEDRSMNIAHVVFPRAGGVTFYLGNTAGTGTDALRDQAERLAAETRWTFEASQKSTIFLHFKKIPSDADLTALGPLLEACYRSAEEALRAKASRRR